MSHPSWVCGLKQEHHGGIIMPGGVTPFVGVWIETAEARRQVRGCRVTPFVGVWIETYQIRITIL